MRRHVITCLSVLLLSVLAGATNYAVKQTGGGDFTTIQACATAMVAGDTCIVYAGTYNENVSVSAGGVSSYKTLQVNGTDVVNVLSFTLNSHDKIIGFHVTNPSAPGPPVAGNADCVFVNASSTDVYITGNTLTQCGGNHGMIAGNFNGSDHVYVQNNTLSYACSSPALTTPECIAITWWGDHWLVENNTISHASDAINYGGSYNVMRGNYLGPFSETECITSGLNPCHIDGFPSEPPSTKPAQFNVIEGNTMVNNIGPDGHFVLAQGDACAGLCHNLIVRENVSAHVGATAILDNNAANGSVNPGFYLVKVYNNTWADLPNDPTVQNHGSAAGFHYNSIDGSEINDIYYFTMSVPAYTPILCADGVSDPYSTCSTFTERNNLAFSTGTITNLYGQVYEQGNWTDIASNLRVDPKFVSYSSSELGDLNLQAGSPAIGAGSYLTTVAAGDSGSGMTLLVNDAAFFQDGFGIAGVQPDQIRVGTSTVVQITSVNYATNTLVLANSITRSPGSPVYLFSDSKGNIVLSGNAPDLGALPSGLQQQTLPPPTGLTALIN